jgi:hypothetical protein
VLTLQLAHATAELACRNKELYWIIIVAIGVTIYKHKAVKVFNIFVIT